MEIDVAKFQLMKHNPFFATLLYNLPVVEDDVRTPTLGVDGETLFVNPGFWKTLKDEEQLGVLCHEVGHLFLGHVWRKGGRDEMAVDPTTGQAISLWNLAGDYVINALIRQFHNDYYSTVKVQLPAGALYDQKYENWSTDEVYEDLKKTIPPMSKKQKEDLLKKSFCDQSSWSKGKGDKKEKEADAKWKALGKQGLEEYGRKTKGNVPAGLKRLMEALEPKEDWRALLRNYVQPFSNDYSFNPVDRRFLDEDFVLPDVKDGAHIDWIAVAVDTSGSIGDKELQAFLTEIKGICESYDSVKVKLTFCDAEASPWAELEAWEPEKIHPTGGGGTDFRPVFNMIKKEETEPKALFYFTDLMGNFPPKQPEYDVVWVVPTLSRGGEPLQADVPFGKVLPNYL